MKNRMFLVAALFSAVTFAQSTDVPPPPPAPDVSPRKVVVSITENGETYTIELPSLESLSSLEDLKGLETLQYLEDLDDENLEFEDFLAEIKADTIDSTSVTIGKWKVIVKEKGDGTDNVDVQFDRIDDYEEEIDITPSFDRFDTEWLLFDLGYNTYVDEDFNFAVGAPFEPLENQKTWGSWDVNLHMFRQRLNFAGGHINLNWGLSFEWHNFMYRGNYIALPQMDTLTLAESPAQLSKNRFSTTHFTLPVILGFETNPYDKEHSFRMGFGYSPGLMMKGKTKIKDDNGTSKVKDDFNLEYPLRHEVNVSIGYGDFNIYGSYDLNPMFAEGQGPQIHPVSIGLIIRNGF